MTTTSAPVSIDFGNGHMYVAGATTVDSFVLHGNSVGSTDGTAALSWLAGEFLSSGSTAQVGAVDEETLLVTLKTDPTPGTVDVVALDNGIITGAAPTAVSAPAGTLTPFGFSVYPDGTAVITLAHSNQDGLFRDGAFASVIAAGQSAPVLDDKAREVRLHCECGQSYHQPSGRHRKQHLRGQPGRRYPPDRRGRSGPGRGRRCIGRHRSHRRSIASDTVRRERVRRIVGWRNDQRGCRERQRRRNHVPAARNGRELARAAGRLRSGANVSRPLRVPTSELALD